MDSAKHMRGLQAEIDHEVHVNKKDGGPSKALKQKKKRPEGPHPNIPSSKVHWEKWEIKLPKDLKKDKKYLALKKELEDIRNKTLELEKEKKYREVGMLIKGKWDKVKELNKRYDELKEKYL